MGVADHQRPVLTKFGQLMQVLDERNQIEKAKLAEMRAARWLHEDHTNTAGGSVWTKGGSEGHQVMQAADRLTAEALGESE